jgi:hypothetical protein
MELQLFVTLTEGIALVVVDYLSVRPHALLGLMTPVGAIIPVLDIRVPGGVDEESLPPNVPAAVIIDYSNAGPFHVFSLGP